MPGINRGTWTGEYFVKYTLSTCSLAKTQKIPELHRVSKPVCKEISPVMQLPALADCLEREIIGFALNRGIISANEVDDLRYQIRSSLVEENTNKTISLISKSNLFEVKLRLCRSIKQSSKV